MLYKKLRVPGSSQVSPHKWKNKSGPRSPSKKLCLDEKMGDVIRCEGLGTVNILDLVARLSEKKPIVVNECQHEPKKSKLRKSAKHRFACPRADCARSFCSQVALDNHIDRHQRTYSCDVCNKIFTEHAKVCRVDGWFLNFRRSWNDTHWYTVVSGPSPVPLATVASASPWLSISPRTCAFTRATSPSSVISATSASRNRRIWSSIRRCTSGRTRWSPYRYFWRIPVLVT